jgi:hypothetical protein
MDSKQYSLTLSYSWSYRLSALAANLLFVFLFFVSFLDPVSWQLMALFICLAVFVAYSSSWAMYQYQLSTEGISVRFLFWQQKFLAWKQIKKVEDGFITSTLKLIDETNQSKITIHVDIPHYITFVEQLHLHRPDLVYTGMTKFTQLFYTIFSLSVVPVLMFMGFGLYQIIANQAVALGVIFIGIGLSVFYFKFRSFQQLIIEGNLIKLNSLIAKPRFIKANEIDRITQVDQNKNLHNNAILVLHLVSGELIYLQGFSNAYILSQTLFLWLKQHKENEF